MQSLWISNTESANSDYSQAVSWTCYFRLETPVLSYDDSGLLSWNAVENADYYNLQIISGAQTFTLNVTETSYDLNNIDGGQLKIFLSARSNSQYLEQSLLTEEFAIDFNKSFKDFDSASINLNSNNLLTVTGSQLITEIDVQIDGIWYVDRPVSATNSDGVYTYYVSLVDFPLSEGSVVMVRPSNIDSYNSYSGSGIQAQFE